MNLKRTQVLALGLMALVALTTFLVKPPVFENISIVRVFPQTKIGTADTLFVLEAVTPTPHVLNYTYTSNSSITVYVQTRSQFNSMDTDVEPDEFLASFSGEKGYLAYEPTDQTIKHVISVYSEGNFIVYDVVLETQYVTLIENSSPWIPVLQLLTFAALGVTLYNAYVESRD
jgi:hypothetical protein